MKTNSAAFYYGSDSEVAPALAAKFDHCSHVTIAFCGGLSILPMLKARHVVANDLHERLINFYRVVAGRCGQLAQRDLINLCQNTLSHPAEMELAKELRTDSASTVDAAWSFWAEVAIGRKGAGGTTTQGGTPSVRRTSSGGSNATRIRTAANELEAWSREFERCEFEQSCFRDLLPKVADRAECGLYCDPPWFGAGDKYVHPFSDDDHAELATMLRRFSNATVVVRYGDCHQVRELYRDGWQIEDRESKTQSGSQAKEIWLIRNAVASQHRKKSDGN